MEESDAQLHFKKRARRRLVGAVALVVLVAVALPMVMDHERKPVVQEVEIRIPGQDEKPFAPKFASAAVDKPVVTPAEPPVEETLPERLSPPVPSVMPNARRVDKPADIPAKPEKAPVKSEKPVEKPSDKLIDKPVLREAADGEAKRVAAILAGKAAESPGKNTEHVILIGAFASEGNIKTIRNKLGELGIKVYTEPLDSPQGHKTRVRAGPFPNREAADKALEKMKRIGVSGLVAAK